MAIHRNGVTSHVGLVLGHGHTRWNDSMHIQSFHASVWNEITQAPQDVFYKDDYSNVDGHFEVDATPEAMAAFEAYTAKVDTERVAYQQAQEFARLEKGKIVQVVRGRKVAKSTIGIIFWIGNNGYGESVGILSLDGAKHFTAATNVECIAATSEQVATLDTLSTASKEKWLAENPRPASGWTRRNDTTKYQRGTRRSLTNLAAGY